MLPAPGRDAIVRRWHARALGAGGPLEGADDRVTRRHLLDVVGEVVPHDFYAFVLTDPRTAVGTSPLAEVPDVEDLPRVIRLKYLTVPGRWTTLSASGCTTLLSVTGGEPDRSPQWKQALRPHGVEDVLLAVLRDRFGTWGFLDLWRTSGVFRDTEVAAVAAALPMVTTVLRSLVARSFVVGAPPPTGQGPGVLLLGDDLRPVVGTPRLHGWLAALLPPGPAAAPVPASALNVGAQLLAVEQGVDRHRAEGRVCVGAGTWLTVRADRLTEALAGASIAVGYEATSPEDRLELFARAHGLSGRERDVLAAVSAGLDTRAAARRLSISEHTVQDHLSSVFARTGSSSRTELLARALGTGAGAVS